MDKQTTRRRFLLGVGAGTLAASAGCLGQNEPNQQSPTDETTERTTDARTASTDPSTIETSTAVRPATTRSSPDRPTADATATRSANGPDANDTRSETATDPTRPTRTGTAGTTSTNDLDPGDLATFAQASFRRNLRQNGFVPDASVPESVEQAWGVPGINVGDHTASKASAVAAPDGSIVVPGDSGEVTSFTPEGAVNWVAGTHPSSYGIHGTPSIANNTVYIGAYDGALYAFDLTSGALRWRTQLGGSIGGSPSYHEGVVYVAVEFTDPSGSLFAVDAATGEIRTEDTWPTDHPHSTPGIDRSSGTLAIGSNDGFLYAWEYPSLERAWRFNAERAIKAPIAVHDGAFIFGSWDSRVFRVDVESGSADWTFETGDFVMSGAGIDTDTDTVYIGSHDGNCYALDAATGEEQWRFDTGGLITGCPAVTGEHVVIGSYDGTLYALTNAGEEVWSVDNEGQITCEPLVHEGSIYYTERATQEVSGGVYRLDPAG